MRKKKNKKTVADTGYKKVDRKEKKKKEKQEEKRRQKKLSVQQSIAYKEMGRDGICRVQGKTYSKCIRFYDINYQLAQNEDKNAIFNQFAVYRVDQQTAGKALWHLPYQEARQQNVSITVENYRVISIHEMQEEEKVADIWKRMKKQCEVSDVLVLNRDGEINCYYVDENYPQYLAGFIRINTSGALITMETENYQIDGKKGNWIATDTIIIDGKQFYLMEHQVYRDQAQGVILDAYGKMVVEECKKFDEKTKQKIHNYIQQQAPLNSVEQLKQDGQIRLEHYQKFYQNGTYERSRESGTEANYDMVDGWVNNQKRNQEKTFDARSNKQTSRNEQDNKPKKLRSVIKRLHQKQIAIARRSGKPIPKYLDQEMERKRG